VLCACAYMAIFIAPLRAQTNSSDANGPNATGSPGSALVSALPDSTKSAGFSGSSNSGVALAVSAISAPSGYQLPTDAHIAIDVLEAIAIAGGYTRTAAPERISVKRRDQILRVDAKRLARAGGKSFRVQPGDTITVGESIF